jgi:hypothetical protein
MPGSSRGSGHYDKNSEVKDLSGAREAAAAAGSPFEDAIDGASKLDRVVEGLPRQPLSWELEIRFNTEPAGRSKSHRTPKWCSFKLENISRGGAECHASMI